MGVIESTPMRAAVGTPGIAASAPMRFIGFQLIGNRLLAGVTSGGTPSSVFERRCTLAGSRTTTHPGANARVPDTQRLSAPVTQRALPGRPSISTSVPESAIAFVRRSRWSRIVSSRSRCRRG